MVQKNQVQRRPSAASTVHPPGTPGVPGKHWAILRARLGSATRITARLADKGVGRVEQQEEYVGCFCCKCRHRRRPVVATVNERISSTQKEMEPLVCLDSCLVIEASRLVAGTEMFLLGACSMCALRELYTHGWTSTEQPSVFAAVYLQYSLFLHWLLFAFVLPVYLRGINNYEYGQTLWHFRLQPLSLLLSLAQIVSLGLALSVDNYWSLATAAQTLLLMLNSVLQVWALTVSITLIDYLKMLKTFVEMADHYGH